jgi:ABC-2 type transport system permease protein
MLWYKAWLETRSRFLVALIGATALCASVVYQLDQGEKKGLVWRARPDTLPAGLLEGHSFLVLIWLIAVTLLMMGGLLRERSNGAASFTLALPVSRLKLMGVRIGVGLAQAFALAVVPWSVMFFVQGIVGKTHSFPQAVFHVALLMTGGMVFFGIALLISSLIDGEYTAPSACFVVIIALAHALDGKNGYNPWDSILGFGYLKINSSQFLASFPWHQAAVFVLIGVALTLMSIKVIQRRDL